MKQPNLLTFHRGEVIYRQGEFSTAMYEVVQGSVDMVAFHGEPDETRLATLEQGQCFGVSAILECYPRVATAVAA